MYPKILDLGPVTVHTYGLLLAAAFIAGIWITSRNARKLGISPDTIWNMGLVVIFSAMVGAKILLLFSNYKYYSDNLREIFSLSTLRSTGGLRCLLRRCGSRHLHGEEPLLPDGVSGCCRSESPRKASDGWVGFAGCCYGSQTRRC